MKLSQNPVLKRIKENSKKNKVIIETGLKAGYGSLVTLATSSAEPVLINNQWVEEKNLNLQVKVKYKKSSNPLRAPIIEEEEVFIHSSKVNEFIKNNTPVSEWERIPSAHIGTIIEIKLYEYRNSKFSYRIEICKPPNSTTLSEHKEHQRIIKGVSKKGTRIILPCDQRWVLGTVLDNAIKAVFISQGINNVKLKAETSYGAFEDYIQNAAKVAIGCNELEVDGIIYPLTIEGLEKYLNQTYIRQEDGEYKINGYKNMGSCQCGDVHATIKFIIKGKVLEYELISFNQSWNTKNGTQIPYIGSVEEMIRESLSKGGEGLTFVNLLS